MAAMAVSPTASYAAEPSFNRRTIRALSSRVFLAFLALALVSTAILPRPTLDATASQSTVAAPASTRSFFVSPGEPQTLSFDDATLEIGAAAVSKAMVVTVAPLGQNAVPALDQGMTNVTRGPRSGYRFLPHHTQFGENIQISLPYDPVLIPDGMTPDDLKTFYFDDQLRRWQELERVNVDTDNHLVVSLSSHFTDMINAAVTVPEHAQPLSDNPNSMKDIKAAEPGAKMNLIEPPQPNNQGDARLSYPIEVPPGRQGMQPSLTLSYNSGGGNGWVGLGWQMDAPAISVDTRWGVPRYGVVPGLSGLRETETYLMDGEQLTPLAHRTDSPPPRATGDKIFHTRVEGQFQQITRHGDLPSNHTWQVVDKHGTTYTYGGCAETSPATACTLRDYAGNIFKWALTQVRDLHGNAVQYAYTRVTDVGVQGGSVPGYQLYLTSINYTQTNGAPGAYTVTFTRASDLGQPRRPDVDISARGGFKIVTADLLKQIEVTFNGQLVRRYELQYVEGAFKKTLLTAITQFGSDGSQFNTHQFSYFDDVRNGSTTYQGFGQLQSWNTGTDSVDWSTHTGTPNDQLLGPLGDFLGFGGASALSGSISDNVGGHVYIGFNPADPDKNLSVGGKIGFNYSDDDTVLTLIDLNGDGLPDKVYKNHDGQVYFRLNQSGPNGQTTFGPPIAIPTLPDLSKENSTTISFGAEAYAGVGNVGVNGLINHAETFTTGSVYFADVNGDGLPDLIENGTVLFNHLVNGVPTFTPNSGDTPVPIGSLAVDSSNLVGNLDPIYQAAIDNDPLEDTLRRWIAPYAGMISISGDFHLVQDTSPARAKYQTADGVRVAIQKNGTELFAQTIGATDYGTKSPAGLNSVPVSAGDRIYFRVGSGFDGKYDQVAWDPVITYQNVNPVTDVNGLAAYRFQGSQDFTLAGRRDISVQMPFDGTVRVTGQLHKSGATTDDVTLLVLKNDQPVFTQTLAWSATGDFALPPDLTVAQHDIIKLRVKVDSPIDVTQVQWNPALFYTAVTGPADRLQNVNVQDTHGHYLIQLNPPFDIDLYPASNLTAPQQAWLVPATGQITVVPQLTAVGGANGVVALTVKHQGALLGKTLLTITNGAVSGPPLTLSVTQGDLLFFDYSSRDPQLSSQLANETVVVNYLTPSLGGVAVPSAFHSAIAPGVFPQPYRGWAMAGYNGNRARATQPINESDLNITFDAHTQYDPRTANAYVFYPSPGQNRWIGGKDEVFVSRDTISSSRLGADFISVPTSSSIAGAQAVSRLSHTQQTTVGGGATAGPLSLTGSTSAPRGTSHSNVDYLDMNGDGFPSIVANGHIQYSTPTGALEPQARAINGLDHPRESSNLASNVGIAGSAAFSKAGAKGQVDTNGTSPPREEKTSTQMVQLGLGGSLGSGDSDVHFDLVDVNGDGLPDRITRNGQAATCGSAPLCVSFNLGYGFGAWEPWGDVPVSAGASHNFALNGSIGFNDGMYGFAGGLSLDKSVSQGGCTSMDLVSTSEDCGSSAPMLIDLTGDGLPDRVRMDNGVVKVAFNTGSGFAQAPGGGLEEVVWSGPLNSASLAKTSNSGLGAGVYFTIGIGPLCLAACYLVINPGVDFARNLARTETAIRDINGDGYPDFLTSNSDGTLQVAPNMRGRTNLLKTVTRPMGASIDLDYQRSGNTYNQPQSRWVLSRVVVFDGHPGDGDVVVNGQNRTWLTTYRYDNGIYNRLEREFYGYGTVTQEERDPSANEALYRSTVHEYQTDSFYTRGLAKRTTTLDSAGRPFNQSEHTYLLRDVGTGIEPVDGQSATATIFPQDVRTDTRYFEGATPAAKATYTTQQFDTLGNIIQFFDAGDLSDAVTATLEYSACPATYVVGSATKIVISGGGPEIRHREANLDCATGNLTQVREYLANGTPAVADMTYFANGNLQTVQEPTNLHGSRATTTYDYDPTVQTHVTSVTDNLGYASHATFNLMFGVVQSSVDINNNVISYTYDAFGRPTSITGPYEQGGPRPTITFEYHPDIVVPWAITKHLDLFRDPSGASTIDTVLFADGLKRTVQTKNSASIFTGPGSPGGESGMIVSGHTTYDFVGRVNEQFYLVTEPLGSAGLFNTAIDSVPPTRTDYDVLSRSTRITNPNGTFTTTTYGFGTDRDGALQFEKIFTDENSISTRTYTNVRDLVTAIKHFNKGGSEVIWTSYAYDPMRQLVRITDDRGNATALTYDNLGRRTSIDNPDTGKTESVYDLASNITAKITANLRAQNTSVAYDYDALNRVTTISYPSFPDENVTYTYGDPGASDNRAARITQVQDQSGPEQRFYGKLGELVKEVKTVVGFTGAPPDTYTTQYVYDSFDRLQNMTYPDGEVLTYHYDTGGMLAQASGVKGPNQYTYLSRLEYDKFGQRAFMVLGNNVTTSYNYDPATRRLQNLQSATSGGTPFQNLLYNYDKVGNVLGLNNDVPVPPPSQFGGPTTQTFGYDDMYRLTSASGTFQFSPDKSNQYTLSASYDTIHNLLSKVQTNNIVQPSSSTITQKNTTYNFSYAYQSPHPHAATNLDGRTFSYDANGNESGWTSDSNGTRRTVVWDDENRVRSLSDNGHEMNYKYNDQGERVVKRGPEGETAYVNQYFTVRNGTLATKHIFAETERLVSKLVKSNAEEKDRFFFHPDHLSSTNEVTDASGDLFEHLEYLPFGETWVDQATNTERAPYLFTGKELDEETGLYYYGARYYDPRTSQFISPDPQLGTDPHKPISMPSVLSVYAYADNNPLRYIDPTGRSITMPKDMNEAARNKVMEALGQLSSDKLGMDQRKDGSWQVVIREHSQAPDRPAGTLLVGNLVKSDKNVSVDIGGTSSTKQVGTADKKGRQDAAVQWDNNSPEEVLEGQQFSMVALPAPTFAAKIPAFIALGHELIHAWRITEGRVVKDKIVTEEFISPQWLQIKRKAYLEELIVVGIAKNPSQWGAKGVKGSSITENMLRSENRLAAGRVRDR